MGKLAGALCWWPTVLQGLQKFSMGSVAGPGISSRRRDRVVERWLREKVGPAYDALKSDPSRAVNADQIRARLAAEHQRAKGRK
jgi:hypothetical protein